MRWQRLYRSSFVKFRRRASVRRCPTLCDLLKLKGFSARPPVLPAKRATILARFVTFLLRICNMRRRKNEQI
jgi:hypothetical protein